MLAPNDPPVLGIGAVSAVVPGYISEISPPRIRGRLGSLWQLAIVFGQLLGLIAGYCLTKLAGSESSPVPWGGSAWRWMFACDALFGVVGIWYRMPSSTRHREGTSRCVRRFVRAPNHKSADNW